MPFHHLHHSLILVWIKQSNNKTYEIVVYHFYSQFIKHGSLI